MFFRRSKPPSAALSPLGVEQLRQEVRAQLADADEETVALVVAVAGLMATVVYADRSYGPEEQAATQAALGRVSGLSAAGASAIGSVLEQHVRDIASINPQAFSRELRENADVELRREVLDLLVDLGAADGHLSLDETNLLRRTTTSLGLSQDDYVISQSRHRDKLKL
jgi:uncharacterized tellurite resistance protein B-like protein